ncbi:MAG: N-acetyltransferase [Bacteroidia bacterium]|nr:MAG: N-acetyltransferase [Bacteroidia bacterium]
MDLHTERLILAEFTWADLEEIHRLHCVPEVDEYNTLGIPANLEETREIMRPFIEAGNQQPQAKYAWGIEEKASGAFIGMAGMSLSNDRFRLGEIFYKLFPDYWGRGYATEVARKLITVGFEDLNLHKIEAGTDIENERSVRVLEKVGMNLEGLRRKILPIRGEWKDGYLYAIVEDDPRP